MITNHGRKLPHDWSSCTTQLQGPCCNGVCFVCRDLLTEDWAHRMSCTVKPSLVGFLIFFSFGEVDSRKTQLGLNL